MERLNSPPISDMIQDEKWNSRMDALEKAWQITIGDTQEEYLQDSAKLSEQYK